MMFGNPKINKGIFSLLGTPMMFGNPKINKGIFSLLGTRTVKRRIIIVGLKSDNSSREMLHRLLNSVVVAGDYVLAVHVQGSDDTFDPNTFYIHEDLCKSKQVDFEVKICPRNCYISELSHQVRINFATILAVGCTSPWPKDSTIAKCLKALPPTCTLLVMDNGGKFLFQKEGSSQEGSSIKILRSSQEESSIKVLRSSVSSLSVSNSCDQPGTKHLFQKSSSMPCSSKSSKPEQNGNRNWPIMKNLQGYDAVTPELFQRLATLEVKGYTRRYTFDELNCATQNFSPDMLIGEGGHSQVYRAVFNNGQAVAVKVLKSSQLSEEDLFREVEISSGLSHENMIHLLGYCYSKEIRAIVYNLLSSSLKQRLKELSWKERMQVAVGVARALDYLHSFYPPIIHRDVKSSNILLSEDCKPLLSDFGAAIVHQQNQQSSAYAKPINVVGTFGYLAPEYMMYGKVDEKIDVYSYGVVLLELITGKEAIQSNSPSNRESLVLWARSLLTCGLCERLIDPELKEDYDKDEMKTMMIAARLCLLHSSSRRPKMKTILHLFEEPEHWLEMHKKREELPSAVGKSEMELCAVDDSDPHDFWVIDDN